MEQREKMKKIAGIDPSLNHTGVVILDEKGNLIHQEVIEAKKLRGIERLRFVKDRLMKVLIDHDIKSVAIEGYSFGSRGRAVFNIGEMGGVLRVALYEAQIEILDVPPSTLKKFVTGKGNADKEQMRIAIKEKYKIDFDDDNEADAFGLAHYLIAS